MVFGEKRMEKRTIAAGVARRLRQAGSVLLALRRALGLAKAEELLERFRRLWEDRREKKSQLKALLPLAEMSAFYISVDMRALGWSGAALR